MIRLGEIVADEEGKSGSQEATKQTGFMRISRIPGFQIPLRFIFGNARITVPAPSIARSTSGNS